jgi:hypothetical protein
VTKPPYPLIPEPTQKSWIERHPHWKIPAGFLLLVLFVAGVLVLVEVAFQNSEVSKQAAAIARANPQVRQLLGEPITVGTIILGNIHINGSAGHAELAIPISGPKGKGVIHAVANERAEVWRFAFLRVSIEGLGEPIGLLPAQPPPGREF